ncbi:MAG: phosphoglycerate mutase family protein [Acidimicrobiales bacterium]
MTLFLVRHGSAGIRNDGDPADTERHLDDTGLGQSLLVAEHVRRTCADAAPVARVLSSPAARCVETVEPLATQLGLAVERTHALFEGTDIEHSWALLTGLAEAGATAVLCSHGDVIPDLVRRAQMRGMEVRGKTGCSKGSIWALDWDGARFATGSYVSKPA